MNSYDKLTTKQALQNTQQHLSCRTGMYLSTVIINENGPTFLNDLNTIPNCFLSVKIHQTGKDPKQNSRKWYFRANRIFATLKDSLRFNKTSRKHENDKLTKKIHWKWPLETTKSLLLDYIASQTSIYNSLSWLLICWKALGMK